MALAHPKPGREFRPTFAAVYKQTQRDLGTQSELLQKTVRAQASTANIHRQKPILPIGYHGSATLMVDYGWKGENPSSTPKIEDISRSSLTHAD